MQCSLRVHKNEHWSHADVKLVIGIISMGIHSLVFNHLDEYMACVCNIPGGMLMALVTPLVLILFWLVHNGPKGYRHNIMQLFFKLWSYLHIVALCSLLHCIALPFYPRVSFALEIFFQSGLGYKMQNRSNYIIVFAEIWNLITNHNCGSRLFHLITFVCMTGKKDSCMNHILHLSRKPGVWESC